MRLFFAGIALLSLLAAARSIAQGRSRSRNSRAYTATPSYDETALRAYFIGLERDARGEAPDPLRDWIEAEQQLVAQTQWGAAASASALTRT
jgi:hypothetical protein